MILLVVVVAVCSSWLNRSLEGGELQNMNLYTSIFFKEGW